MDLSPEWMQNVHKSAEMCMVCQFIVEISVKKPANCDSRMTRFRVNSVKMHICSF